MRRRSRHERHPLSRRRGGSLSPRPGTMARDQQTRAVMLKALADARLPLGRDRKGTRRRLSAADPGTSVAARPWRAFSASAVRTSKASSRIDAADHASRRRSDPERRAARVSGPDPECAAPQPGTPEDLSTLSWCTPVHPANSTYRGVRLQWSTRKARETTGSPSTVPSASPQPRQRRARTIHRVFEGEKRIKALPEGGLFIGVQALRLARGVQTAARSLRLGVTVEVAQTLRSGHLRRRRRQYVPGSANDTANASRKRDWHPWTKTTGSWRIGLRRRSRPTCAKSETTRPPPDSSGRSRSARPEHRGDAPPDTLSRNRARRRLRHGCCGWPIRTSSTPDASNPRPT